MQQGCTFELTEGSFLFRPLKKTIISLYQDRSFSKLYSQRSENTRILCGLPTVQQSTVCELHKCNVSDCYQPSEYLSI